MNDLPRLRPRHRWTSILLVLSLALNAFFAVALATDLLRVKWWPGDRESRAVRFELRWLEGRLDAEAMQRVETAVTGARSGTVARFERLRELRSELAALAAVAEPDRDAIDAQLAAIRAEIEAMQAESQRVTMDALLDLPPEVRRRLAEPPAPR